MPTNNHLIPTKIPTKNVERRIWDFTWRVSDCEELVGVTQTRRKKMY
jgi:hypothetical protein